MSQNQKFRKRALPLVSSARPRGQPLPDPPHSAHIWGCEHSLTYSLIHTVTPTHMCTKDHCQAHTEPSRATSTSPQCVHRTVCPNCVRICVLRQCPPAHTHAGCPHVSPKHTRGVRPHPWVISLRSWQHSEGEGRGQGLPPNTSLQDQTFGRPGTEARASGPLNIHLKSHLSNNSAETSAKRAHSPSLVFRSRRRKETGESRD